MRGNLAWPHSLALLWLRWLATQRTTGAASVPEIEELASAVCTIASGSAAQLPSSALVRLHSALDLDDKVLVQHMTADAVRSGGEEVAAGEVVVRPEGPKLSALRHTRVEVRNSPSLRMVRPLGPKPSLDRCYHPRWVCACDAR